MLSVRYSIYGGKKGHRRHQNYGMTKGRIKEILRDRSFIIRLREGGGRGWGDLRGGGGHEKNMALERGQREKYWI